MANDHMNVGEKIRSAREQRADSLRQLAQKAGISPSLLSQIENTKVDPSLSTLRKIAIALDVPLFQFVLEESGPAQRVVRSGERKKVLFPQAGLQYEILHSDPQKKMGIHEGCLVPGGATSDDLLTHQGEECVVVLDGVLTTIIGDETLSLSVGDSVYFDSSVPHRLINRGEKDCRFCLIITPPKF